MRSPSEGADPGVFRALADPTRRSILRVLGGGELRAGEVAARFPLSRPAISRHLRVLRGAGLVEVRAEGRARWYRIVPGPLRDAAAHVEALDAWWREGLDRLGGHLAGESTSTPGPSARVGGARDT